MKQPIKQGYPTREELAEVLELRKNYGKEGIRLFLRKQRERRAEMETALQGDEKSGSNATG